ncbi:MAG TPA: SGNH/GDSL hydrolase family protein [Actinomycetes bacterium]|nr:SGNH/GDSL hydrolase family protein [Actinomycetes bacterium]
MHRLVRRWVAVFAAVCLSVLGLAFVAAGPAQASGPHGGTYVSVGDSLAFGYQPNLVAAQDFDPTHYVSYAEDYAWLHPWLKLANFGCPGETSTSLINGGCPWQAQQLPTHVPYTGSQLTAAVAYIKAHPNTSLISVDIGSNDLLQLVEPCNGDLTCVEAGLPSVLATLAHNYAYVLTALHAAAPNAQLVVFNLYNPLAVAVPGSDALLTSYVNPLISQIAAAFGANVADAFTAINFKAGSALEPLLLCVRTWECSSYKNIHPTTLGYFSLNTALARAVG